MFISRRQTLTDNTRKLKIKHYNTTKSTTEYNKTRRYNNNKTERPKLDHRILGADPQIIATNTIINKNLSVPHAKRQI